MNDQPLPVKCNGCDVCCVAPSIGIQDVEYPLTAPKPAGKRCSHLMDCGGGCACYSNRPTICSAYACIYATGQDPQWPKETGVAFTFQPSGDALRPNDIILVGHCTGTLEEAEADAKVMAVVERWLKRSLKPLGPYNLFCVTLRTTGKVKSFRVSGHRGKNLQIDVEWCSVDQSDPLLQRLVRGTEGGEENAMTIRL